MLPTTERRLRKQFAGAIHNMELKIKWFAEQLEHSQQKNRTLHQKVLTLQQSINGYRITLVCLVLGILLYSIL